jgi:predicted nucleotidyltransferase
VVATTLELENVFEDFAKRLEAGITVEAIVLYGSYARGNAYEGSDIDVAVISPDFEGVPTYLRQRTIAKHSLRRDGRISPIGYASSEYHDPPPYSFLAEIVRTGKVVYPRREA